MAGSRIAALLVALVLLAPSAAVAQAASPGAIEAPFRDWLAGTVWPEAVKAGVSRATFDRAFAGVTPDRTLPDLQAPGSTAPPRVQHQAEFQAPGRYFVEAQLATLGTEGRNLLNRFAPLLDRIEAHYGVPREIVVAVWGRESGFGRVSPDRPAIRVLATQAFMGRRRELYGPELVAALQILEQGLAPPGGLVSTWAGAMGQPQFLPSKVLRFAADGDGDGRRDIWRSAPDSLASIANYLAGHGWQRGRAWGAEVRVPDAVSCALEGPRQGRPMREWIRLGLARADGGAPDPGGDGPVYLLMPAGRLGPAFLVSDNFYVLKAYNESDLYALFVGHVADRMRGARAFAARWQPTDPMTRGGILGLQHRLQAEGYDVGRADGLIGFATRTAIGQWQARSGRAETCFPDAALIRELRG
ncbi:MAG TPA: lytic murein transglycosylase [Microvirga sp.]|jgi:lytic murein transglycosylase|nr:lytic murein transglycosylase [Microvirga sp.]